MRFFLLLVFLSVAYFSSAQVYYSGKIFKNEPIFEAVQGDAWLSYDRKNFSVELIFRDSIYCYDIVKDIKPRNKKKFLVRFVDSKDELLWNLEEENHYFFVFKIDGVNYWFSDLVQALNKEYDIMRESAIPAKCE